MPFLNVKICGPESVEVTKKVSAFLTKHTVAILGKKEDVIAIAVEYLPASQWAVGGAALAGRGLGSFYLNIKITEGTNSKNEKASYVEKVFAEFASTLGKLTPASYIVIHDVRADAWGFAGATQEYRYINGKIF